MSSFLQHYWDSHLLPGPLHEVPHSLGKVPRRKNRQLQMVCHSVHHLHVLPAARGCVCPVNPCMVRSMSLINKSYINPSSFVSACGGRVGMYIGVLCPIETGLSPMGISTDLWLMGTYTGANVRFATN